MKDKDPFLIFLIIVVIFCTGFFSGAHMGESVIRQEAIAVNAAHYEVDKQAHVKFTWNFR